MKTLNFKPPSRKYAPVIIAACFSILISFFTRLALLLLTAKDADTSALSLAGIFIFGFVYDFCVACFIILPLVLNISFTTDIIYTKKGLAITSLFFLALLLILKFTSLIPEEFNKDLHKGIIAYIILRFLIYLFLYSKTILFRHRWRNTILLFFLFITIFLLLFNAVSEWFFWKEFSARYNFIAVDYLVYTNEMIGNIKESYPLFSIISTIVVLTTAIVFLFRKPVNTSVAYPFAFKKRIGIAVLSFSFTLVPLFIIKPGWKNFSTNNYTNDLSGNGIYEFVQAFQKNDLDFTKYYKTIPDSTAFRIMRSELASPNSVFTSNDIFNLERIISYPQPERKMNVVLISIESFSASFMTAFGNTQHITPNIDSLSKKSLFFTNLYASGTRTVRGLEALSLSLPPTPGQSIVKRPGNENLFSLGSVFKSKGYITQYIYGGYGYFDNMKYFFGNNDYAVLDRTTINKKDIHYANIWGVADEDLFTMALHSMDENYKKGKAFFSQVMTVSNHRPYTYPEGRIDISPSTQTRDGAVKYTDYAIGSFLKQAATKPWFSNTIFVIVADHCASSAGKEALPVTGYHIPMLIYSPGNLIPAEISALTSQIDIAPTILGLLHFDYTTKFFGQDVLNTAPEKRKAFISTYQGLGFIKDNELVIQSPVKKINSYTPDFKTGDATPLETQDSMQIKAIAYYQAAAWLIKNKKYGKSNTGRETSYSNVIK